MSFCRDHDLGHTIHRIRPHVPSRPKRPKRPTAKRHAARSLPPGRLTRRSTRPGKTTWTDTPDNRADNTADNRQNDRRLALAAFGGFQSQALAPGTSFCRRNFVGRVLQVLHVVLPVTTATTRFRSARPQFVRNSAGTDARPCPFADALGSTLEHPELRPTGLYRLLARLGPPASPAARVASGRAALTFGRFGRQFAPDPQGEVRVRDHKSSRIIAATYAFRTVVEWRKSVRKVFGNPTDRRLRSHFLGAGDPKRTWRHTSRIGVSRTEWGRPCGSGSG